MSEKKGKSATERTSARDATAGWTTHARYRARGEHSAKASERQCNIRPRPSALLRRPGLWLCSCFLGMDEQGRDIYSYLEGQTWLSSGSGLSDDLLVQAASVIRSYHDITAGSTLAQGHEIVAHHELGPHNTIFQENRLIGFIDWDDAAPGTRLRDLANAVYNYVDVSHWANQTADEQARRIQLMCAAYGWADPIALINDFEADLQQALRNHQQAGRPGAIKVFEEEVSWMRQRAQELRLAFQ